MGMYFSGFATRTGEGCEDSVRRLARELDAADAVLVGAGAGLSTSAGLTYSGERLARYFPTSCASIILPTCILADSTLLPRSPNGGGSGAATSGSTGMRPFPPTHTGCYMAS